MSEIEEELISLKPRYLQNGEEGMLLETIIRGLARIGRILNVVGNWAEGGKRPVIDQETVKKCKNGISSCMSSLRESIAVIS